MKDALEKIPASNPDLVIVDISLDGDKDGIDLARSLRAQYMDLRVLVVSGHEGAIYAGLIVILGRMAMSSKETPMPSSKPSIKYWRKANIFPSPLKMIGDNRVEAQMQRWPVLWTGHLFRLSQNYQSIALLSSG
jgi:energy-converting hydrogenase Eha subunit A